MKIVTICIALCLGMLAACTGCSTTQDAQVTYVQACTAYGIAFNGVLQLRVAGKLTPTQIDQVTIIEQRITPICTGALPADVSAATVQITTAVTSLGLIEVIKKEGTK